MTRTRLLSLLLVGIMVSGCTQPTGLVGDPYSATPSPHAPSGTVVHMDTGNGTSAGRGPEWSVGLSGWSEALPSRDAVLGFDIEVEHYRWPHPLDVNDWRLRLSVLNGTVEVPNAADWYRSYSLQWAENATVSHPTEILLGDLRGDRLGLRLTTTHLFQDGRWATREYDIAYEPHDDGYRLLWSHGYGRCGHGWGNATCPWSGLPAEESPPPPPDW